MSLKIMNWIEKYDLFLLDFDGLLVNTEQLHHEAYQIMCKKRGFTLSWNFDQFCGIAHRDSTGLQKEIYTLFPELYRLEPNWEVLYAEKKEAYLEILKKGQIQFLPGVEEFLRSLASLRVKRCVATNSAKDQIAIIRRALPLLDSIPVWVTREQYLNSKPAPDAYLKAISILADPGDKIIGFEDSMRGIQALQKADVKPVLICSSKHPQLAEMDLKGVSHFPSFEKIPPSGC